MFYQTNSCVYPESKTLNCSTTTTYAYQQGGLECLDAHTFVMDALAKLQPCQFLSNDNKIG